MRDREEQLEDLLAQWQELTEKGQPVEAMELCRDCPELTSELARRIQIFVHLGQLRGQVDSGLTEVMETSHSPLPPETRLTATPVQEGGLPELALLQPGGDRELGRLGRFHIFEVLGRGGMGVVLRAEDEMLRRPVAIKLLRTHLAAQEVSRERFLREARASARLEHPHVVAIHHVDEIQGVPYLVMPLLKGEPLDRRLARQGRPDVAWTVRIARQVASGLAAAHAAGLIHRDVKPANVWLKEPDDSVVLLDFGLARVQEGETSITRSGEVMGTPAYMAPEQADAQQVDGRADLFSLGCVLYEMVTGQRPFSGKTRLSLIKQLATRKPPPPSDLVQGLPPGLSELIGQMMAKSRDERPSSAAEVESRLREIEQRLVPIRRSEPSSGKLWYQIVMLVGVVAALAFSILGLLRFLGW